MSLSGQRHNSSFQRTAQKRAASELGRCGCRKTPFEKDSDFHEEFGLSEFRTRHDLAFGNGERIPLLAPFIASGTFPTASLEPLKMRFGILASIGGEEMKQTYTAVVKHDANCVDWLDRGSSRR